MKEKRSFKDDVYSAFSFFMALYCQVFPKNAFYTIDMEFQETTDANGMVKYHTRHDVCGDGNVRLTITYDTVKYDDVSYSHERECISQVYKSPNVNINVDLSTNSNGYYPKGRRKNFFHEFVLYGKTNDKDLYEDCGFKHLY